MKLIIKKVRGYSLIELMIVLCITSILLSFALPGFASMLRTAQSDTAIYSVVNAYHLARSTAISQRKPVIFCAKADVRTCGSDWARGALVFVDPNNNRIQDDDERVLADIAAPPTGSHLIMKAALNKQYLRFMDNGMLENTAGSMVYCPPNGTARDARNIIFTCIGRLRFGGDVNHDGIRENAEGQPLDCPS